MSNPRIGVIGLPEVAAAFEDIGLEVITAARFSEAAKAIRSAVEESAAPGVTLAVLVEDRKQIGLQPLLTRLQDAARIVVARGEEPQLPGTWTSIAITSSLADYASALGLDDEADLLDGYEVLADGTVAEAEQAPSPTAMEGRDDSAKTERPTSVSDRNDTAPYDGLSTDEDASAERDLLPEAHSARRAEQIRARQRSLSDDLFADDPDTEELTAQPAVDPYEQEIEELPTSPSSPDDLFDDDPEPEPEPVARPARRRVVSIAQDDPERRSLSRPAHRPTADTLFDDGFAQPEPKPARPARRRADTGPIEIDDALDGIDDDIDDTDHLDASDDEDAFERALTSGRDAARIVRRGRAPVIFCIAGKGGVGKSSMTIALAQRAAVRGDLSVCVIDMNRGQGDIATFLKIARSNLPTIYEAAQIQDVSKAFLSPAKLEPVRGDRAERLEFTVVCAPRRAGGAAEANPKVVSAGLYRQAIEYARDHYDLVLVDTQIIEAYDNSGLIDGVVLPTLTSGGWAVGIADHSRPGLENLVATYSKMAEAGVDTARLMTVMNRIEPSTPSLDAFEKKFGRRSRWMGAVYMDERIRESMNASQIPHSLSSLAPALDAVLLRVTGMDEFAPRRGAADREDSQTQSRPGFFARLLGRA